jgi:hypothetical protein
MKVVDSPETLPTKLHGFVSQNTVILIFSNVRSSDLIISCVLLQVACLANGQYHPSCAHIYCNMLGFAYHMSDILVTPAWW